MHSSTSNFERVIPALPWRGVTLAVLLIVSVAATAWELHCRALGYRPTLNDTDDLWAQSRRRVQPASFVIIGDSRALFDLDLDEIERGLGSRPVQLGIVGSSPYPVLVDLADDEHFYGTVIASVVPKMFFAVGGPHIENSNRALKRYHRQTLAQRASQNLGMLLEEHIAFLKQEDLTLNQLLMMVPIPNRPAAMVPPSLPPYFQSTDRDRRARMIESCAQPGELQTRIQQTWLRLFSLPPPPSYIPPDVFKQRMQSGTEARFNETKIAVDKIRARGGSVVFIRFPHSGQLKALEDRMYPRAQFWDRLLRETSAPGICYADYPELASFTCPEWSHLSAGDSVEFTRRLVPRLRAALPTPHLARK
ncbi:MAG: hypothetical protein ACR2HH_08850 [Chthoniobacterales bacterium]